ncbi:MAG: hypothetical protein EAZ55_05625 [Cytophagales bacterium]|nr:MAG: hypothetical protein EAZ55_05625 [Cytophagales bacterium]
MHKLYFIYLFKSIFLLCLIFAYSLALQAQNKLTDSLENLLKTKELSEADQVVVYTALCWNYRSDNYLKGLEYGRKAIELAEKVKDYKNWSEASNFTGVIYRNLGDYPEAIRHYFQALKIAEEHRLKAQIAYSNNNVGEIYKFQKQYKEALEFTQKAIDMFEELKDERGLGYGYIRQGEIYQDMKEYDKAFEIFMKSYQIRLKKGDKDNIQSSLVRIGEILAKQAKYKESLKYHQEAYDLAVELNNKRAIILSTINLSSVYLALGEDEKASELALKGFDLSRKIGSKEYVRRSSKILTSLYANKKDFVKAFEFQTIYSNISDSLVNEENNNKLLALHRDYDLARKQVEIDLANKDRAIQQTISFTVVIILALVFTVTFLLYRSNQEKKKVNGLLTTQNQEIETKNSILKEQNEIIEKKNDDNISSLLYARRIQEALLPETKNLVGIKESFIYLQPRDIVSGDFYWFQELEDRTIIAAVDCTGHGVPGAFMSMLGISALNNIVSLKKIYESDLILKELNQDIDKMLRQAQTKNRDGMDLALCVIYKNKPIVEFAGAHNPLIYIQNQQLTQVNATKASIGGFLSEVVFEKTTIDVSQGAMLYMFSDGLQDQFGGPKNKKFMLTRLKSLLYEIHTLPMEAQKRALDSAMMQWMEESNQKQIDDILLIGIKV